MHYRVATVNDAPLLAELNHQLIHDEGHRNPMSVPELADRMRDWIISDYSAILFESDSDVVAYALYREEKESLYLRQFFVRRELRRSGIGRQCIDILFSEIWPQDKRISVDVLTQNTGGISFWRSVGFSDYCLTLEIYPNLKTKKPNQAVHTNGSPGGSL